jgi:hypothetical protein
MVTIEEINENNEKFWKEKTRETDERMKDKAVLEAALARLHTERFLPVKYQTDFGPTLEQAEQDQLRFARSFARHGGAAKKTDALQKFIEAAVQAKRATTVPELLDMLRNAAQPGGPIEDIDEENVSFLGANGRLRDAPISGLKDRLSRAKKELKSKN